MNKLYTEIMDDKLVNALIALDQSAASIGATLDQMYDDFDCRTEINIAIAAGREITRCTEHLRQIRRCLHAETEVSN